MNALERIARHASNVSASVLGRVRYLGHRALTHLKFRHVYGRRTVPLTDNDVIVVCMVRDGAFFIERFINYHLGLGVAHIFFVDNGSSDDTIKLASSHENVSVFSNHLPVSRYECLIRREALHKFARNHWCLVLDIDEQFDYLGSNALPITALASYLNEFGYNAVVAQMLDLIPETTLYGAHDRPECFDSTYVYYDITQVRRMAYHDKSAEIAFFLRSNSVGNSRIDFLFGGVRNQLFGHDNCLTKHPLIRNTDGLRPVTHAHCSSHAKCADFTALLRHYKFAGDFRERISRSAKARTWDHGGDELIAKALDDAKDPLDQAQLTRRKLSNTQQLLAEGFLVASSRYQTWAGDFPE